MAFIPKVSDYFQIGTLPPSEEQSKTMVEVDTSGLSVYFLCSAMVVARDSYSGHLGRRVNSEQR